MPLYYPSVFEPPLPPITAATPTVRDGWQAVTPTADRRPPRPQQPLVDTLPLGHLANVPQQQQGWECVGEQPRRPLQRQQTDAAAANVYPASAGAVIPGGVKLGWDAVVATPLRSPPRRQPDADPVLVRVTAVAAAPTGWDAVAPLLPKPKPRRQPDYDAVPIRLAAAVVATPLGWDAVNATLPRPRRDRQTAGGDDVLFKPAAATPGSGGVDLFFIW